MSGDPFHSDEPAPQVRDEIARRAAIVRDVAARWHQSGGLGGPPTTWLDEALGDLLGSSTVRNQKARDYYHRTRRVVGQRARDR